MKEVEQVTVKFKDGTIRGFFPSRQVSLDVDREVLEIERFRDGVNWKITISKKLMELE